MPLTHCFSPPPALQRRTLIPWASNAIQVETMEMDAIDCDAEFRLNDIIERRALSAWFQPIVDLESGTITAYEGLIRGPSNSVLHAPLQLFRAAARFDRTVDIEHLCRRITLETYTRLRLGGDLFLNVSPECLIKPEARYGETLDILRHLAIDPQRVVIELTEHQPAYDYGLLREAVTHYRDMGFRIAIDDLGEGFSSLRLWSELHPDFVKIDMHFIQGCDTDPVKKQFLRSIQEIARNSGCKVIAEGIETASELSCVRDIGIAYGQGYFFARPSPLPQSQLAGDAALAFVRHGHPTPHAMHYQPTAARLLRNVTPIAPTANIEEAYALFERDPSLQSLPVVEQGVPVGIIGRYTLIDRLARPFRRELFGRKPCDTLMNNQPLMIESNTTLQDLGRIIGESEPQHLADGFIIVTNGLYQGIGTGQDLMREITQMQIQAARHANSLTGLPGNEPINATITGLLETGKPFWAAYFDLDHFKPFNDVHGYSAGDDAIRMLAQALVLNANPAADFVGHIGGDDFLVLFCSADWEDRCHLILEQFGESISKLYAPEHLLAGGYEAENRQGKRSFIPLVSLSIGVVPVTADIYRSYRQISAAAAAAKKEAKKIPGNSLFVERRQHVSAQASRVCQSSIHSTLI